MVSDSDRDPRQGRVGFESIEQLMALGRMQGIVEAAGQQSVSVAVLRGRGGSKPYGGLNWRVEIIGTRDGERIKRLAGKANIFFWRIAAGGHCLFLCLFLFVCLTWAASAIHPSLFLLTKLAKVA